MTKCPTEITDQANLVKKKKKSLASESWDHLQELMQMSRCGIEGSTCHFLLLPCPRREVTAQKIQLPL